VGPLSINVLSTELANQIAAGEVIERPSSAVKELIENSLDAGATHISIEIAQGGLTLLRVTDDGLGMSGDDLRLCLLRHATSKLQTIDDLFSITTLGFRGEALPSIAAVSHLTLQSRLRVAEEGQEIICSGGQILDSRPVGMPPGTTVAVRDLFFNTPARLKFMKSASAEGQKVLQVVERIALSHPSTRFTLKIDDRVVLQTQGNNNLVDAALSVYGVAVAKQLHYFAPQGARSLTLSGVLGDFSLHRHNRLWQTIYLNGRYIESRRLSAILEQAYRTLLPPKRSPVAILHLQVPASEVDVNVHPTKVEVRFRDEQAICGAFMNILRQQLEVIAGRQVGRDQTPVAGKVTRPELIPWQQAAPHIFVERREQSIPSQLTILPPTAPYRLIGQFGLSYILIEKQGRLLIVDQHAAHERVLWEQFMTHSHGVQALSIPIPIDFGPAGYELAPQLTQLENLGFALEHFGGNTYLLRTMPTTYLGNFNAEVVREIALGIESDHAPNWEETFAAKLACRAAIKAGTRLSPSEMVELLDKLYATNLPVTCPHGRPIEISFTEDELYKLFHPK